MKEHVYEFGAEHICTLSKLAVENWQWRITSRSDPAQVVAHSKRGCASPINALHNAQRAAVAAGVSPTGKQRS